MIINTILIENDSGLLYLLTKKIAKCCPSLIVNAVANSVAEAQIILRRNHSDLMIANLEILSLKNFRKTFVGYEMTTEIIYISYSNDHALEALRGHAAEFIIRPIQDNILIAAVENARKRLRVKEENKKNKLLLENILTRKTISKSIGIPTIEGFVFFSTSEIIRCEGLQKCTRIITTTKTDIISSYNIGEFKKLLEPFGFFATHKSHLINLAFVKHYRREGTIILKDNSHVPVAKRRKGIFLKQVIHP